THDDKSLPMFQHLAQDSVRCQINEATANVGHDQREPARGNVPEEVYAKDSSHQGGRLDSSYPAKRDSTLKAGANQQAPQGEAFRNFVDAQCENEGPLCRRGSGNMLTNTKSEAIGRAMDR